MEVRWPQKSFVVWDAGGVVCGCVYKYPHTNRAVMHKVTGIVRNIGKRGAVGGAGGKQKNHDKHCSTITKNKDGNDGTQRDTNRPERARHLHRGALRHCEGGHPVGVGPPLISAGQVGVVEVPQLDGDPLHPLPREVGGPHCD